MDRFRFRVWDNEEKLYQEADADYCHITHTGELECRFTNDNGLYCSYVYIDDYVIEQCTGLKDKNGKLIYEGDVVKFDDINGTIVFKNGCFVWDWKFNDPPIYNFDNIDLEIIGNIHEMEGKDEDDK